MYGHICVIIWTDILSITLAFLTVIRQCIANIHQYVYFWSYNIKSTFKIISFKTNNSDFNPVVTNFIPIQFLLLWLFLFYANQHKAAGLKIKLSKTTTTKVCYLVPYVLRKVTAFHLWSAMDSRCNKNMVSPVSSVNVVMHYHYYYYYYTLQEGAGNSADENLCFLTIQIS